MHNIAKLCERTDGDAMEWNGDAAEWNGDATEWNGDVRTAVNESAH